MYYIKSLGETKRRQFLSDGTKAHVKEDEDGIIVTFECVRCFDAEDLAMIESEEKGSSSIDVVGVTMVFAAEEAVQPESTGAVAASHFAKAH